MQKIFFNSKSNMGQASGYRYYLSFLFFCASRALRRIPAYPPATFASSTGNKHTCCVHLIKKNLINYLKLMIMETLYNTEIVNSSDFITRLGFREVNTPATFFCSRNGEALELKVYFFENRDSSHVVYYTEAIYQPAGQLRHTALFRFNRNEPHEQMHKYCLHSLFFDEQIEVLFEQENKFHPPAHLHTAKADTLLDWVRSYWNTQYFNKKYKALGGLNSKKDLICN